MAAGGGWREGVAGEGGAVRAAGVGKGGGGKNLGARIEKQDCVRHLRSDQSYYR